MSDENQPLWQGRGHIESFGGPAVQLVGNPPEMSLSDVDAVLAVVALFTVNERGQIRELSGSGYERAPLHNGRAMFPQCLADWPEVTHFSYGTTDEELTANITEMGYHPRKWPLMGKQVVLTLHSKMPHGFHANDEQQQPIEPESQTESTLQDIANESPGWPAYISIKPDGSVVLDGNFTPAQLRKIADLMES